MKHLAWLHAVPDPEYRKKHQGAPERKTRQDQLQQFESALLQLPEVEYGAHVIEWLHGIGVTENGDNGIKPLSWQEINAWKQANDVSATREELEMLYQLSRVYVAQYHRSNNPDEPPPNRARNVDKDALKSRVRSVIRQSAEHRKKT